MASSSARTATAEAPSGPRRAKMPVPATRTARGARSASSTVAAVSCSRCASSGWAWRCCRSALAPGSSARTPSSRRARSASPAGALVELGVAGTGLCDLDAVEEVDLGALHGGVAGPEVRGDDGAHEVVGLEGVERFRERLRHGVQAEPFALLRGNGVEVSGDYGRRLEPVRA